MIWRNLIPACILAFLSLCLSAQSPHSLQYHPDLLGWQGAVPRSAGLFTFNSSFWKSNLDKKPLTTLAEMRWEALEFKVDDLPVFCRMEVKMEQAVKFPVKFRLGEVQYVERMEGKY